MPSIPLPGSTFTFSVPLVSQADSHLFKAAPTIAAGDFQRSINNGAFANMDNLPAVTPTGGKLVQFVVSAAETTAAGEGGTIDIVGSDAAGAEWDDIGICLRVGVIAANAAQLSGDATAADNLELFFDGTGYASAGSINSVNGTVSANLIQIDGETTPVDNLVLSIGSGGFLKANLVQILGTTLTESSGQIAAAFRKFFNVATPTGTVNSLPDAVAGAVNGLAIVGSEMDLVDAPNATAIAAIQAGLSTLGSGAITFTYTLQSSVDASPIADADVWLTTDSAGRNVIAVGRTNAAGQVVFYLDAGTIYVWRQKTGWTFANPDTEVVA